LLIGGLVVGGLAKSATDLIKDPGIADLLRKMGGGSGLLEDVYLTTEIGFISVIAAAFGIVVALRLRSEEVAGHAEQVLADRHHPRPVCRVPPVVGLLGSAVLMLVLGGVIGVVDAAAGALGRGRSAAAGRGSCAGGLGVHGPSPCAPTPGCPGSLRAIWRGEPWRSSSPSASSAGCSGCPVG
jgi:ABC-2 type transport system permease protein